MEFEIMGFLIDFVRAQGYLCPSASLLMWMYQVKFRQVHYEASYSQARPSLFHVDYLQITRVCYKYDRIMDCQDYCWLDSTMASVT